MLRVYGLQIPLPQIPLIIVGIIPNVGDEDATTVCGWNKKVLELCGACSLNVLSFGSDGANVECKALESLLDDYEIFPSSDNFKITELDVDFKCKLKINGMPFVRLPDYKHLLKTSRNAWLSGARILMMGNGYVSIVNLTHIVYRIGHSTKTPMKVNDVVSVDKQDDAAAFRLFHSGTMEDCLDNGFICSAVYIYVIGQLVDALLERSLPHVTRIRMIMCSFFFLRQWKCFVEHMSIVVGFKMISTARNFLAPQTYGTLLKLCENSVMLIISHAKYHADVPLCLWLHGTEPLEHLFGICRQILPDFTLLDFKQMLPKIKRMMHIWLKDNLKGLDTHEGGGNHGYVIDYCNDAKRIPECAQKFPCMNSILHACRNGHDDAKFLLRLVNMHSIVSPVPRNILNLCEDSEDEEDEQPIDNLTREMSIQTLLNNAEVMENADRATIWSVAGN